MSKAIKDLKALSILRDRACYRHSGPTDLKRTRDVFFHSANDGEGQALALREREPFFFVSRGPVPREQRATPLAYRSAGACPPRSLSSLCVLGPLAYMSIEKRVRPRQGPLGP